MSQVTRGPGPFARHMFAAVLVIPTVMLTGARGDPIPGLDVKLGRNPGGIIATQGSAQVFTINVAIGSVTLAPYAITVTGARGRIAGTVVKAVPPTGKVIR